MKLQIKGIRFLAFLLACLPFLFVACTSNPAAVEPDSTVPVDQPDQATVTPTPEPDPAELFRLELEAIGRLALDGSYKEAETRLDRLATANPERADLRLLQASLRISLGDLDGAAVLVDRHLSTFPDDLKALQLRAELYRFSGKQADRRKTLEQIIARDPDNSDALSSLGMISYESKNYQEAERFFLRSLAAEASHVPSLVGLAQIYYRRRDYQSAKEKLDKAAALAPLDPSIYLDRSRVLYQLGQFKACEADLSTSIELLPSAWAHLERGRLYLDTGRLAQAERDFDAAIALNPDFFLTYIYRGGLYEQQGRDEAAFLDYKTVTSINADYWYVWESMGTLAVRLGRWSEAAQAFDKASGFTAAHNEYYIAAGLAMMMNGQNREARDYARRNLPKIDRSKEPLQWLLLRQVMDQNISSGDIEQEINREKNLDRRAAGLFYLSLYWVAKGELALGRTYLQVCLEADRQNTIEWRMAEAMVKQLAEAR